MKNTSQPCFRTTDNSCMTIFDGYYDLSCSEFGTLTQVTSMNLPMAEKLSQLLHSLTFLLQDINLLRIHLDFVIQCR